jgi:hypothetical protein
MLPLYSLYSWLNYKKNSRLGFLDVVRACMSKENPYSVELGCNLIRLATFFNSDIIVPPQPHPNKNIKRKDSGIYFVVMKL